MLSRLSPGAIFYRLKSASYGDVFRVCIIWSIKPVELNKRLKANLDFALLTVVVAGFSRVAAQRLGKVPLPDSGDEAGCPPARKAFH